MEWTGRASFHANKQYVSSQGQSRSDAALTGLSFPLQSFVVDGEDAGQTQEGGGLIWATIEGAGE